MSVEPKKVLDAVRDALVAFDVDRLKKVVLDAVQLSVPPQEAIAAMSRGMEIVGERYESKEYFLPELIQAGETMKEGLAALKPYMTNEMQAPLGTIVVATVQGDLHDIGKNILATLLTTAGFEVIDLGVDVPAEKIVEAVKDSEASIVGLSALLTTTMEQMKIVVDKLKSAGLRNRVKIIVGGTPVTAEYAKEIGADDCARSAIAGVEICRKWTEKK